MNNRPHPFFWSFSIGTWKMTQVRVSVYFPLIVILFCLYYGLQVGATFSAILFVSVLIHEFAHIVAARLTGGYGDEVLIWPLGGLASVQPANSFVSRFVSAAAGPFSNLIICAITLYAVLDAPDRRLAFDPLVFPLADPKSGFSANLASDLLVLVFAANWMLLLVNLIPVYPLDGGRMLQTALSTRLSGDMATEIYLRVGFFAAFIVVVVGMLTTNVLVVLIGAMVLLLNMQESFQTRTGESYEESFMGYDFSQGYTSLERADETRPPQKRGFFQAWREKRREKKALFEQSKNEEAERQLDELLAKVHHHGINALTDAERRLLNRVSARFRDKGKQPD